MGIDKPTPQDEERRKNHHDLRDWIHPTELPVKRLLRAIRKFSVRSEPKIYTDETSVVRISDFPLEKFKLLNSHLEDLKKRGLRIVPYQPVVVGRYEDDQLVTVNITKFVDGVCVADLVPKPELLAPQHREKVMEDVLNWLVIVGEYLLEKTNHRDMYYYDHGISQIMVEHRALEENTGESAIVLTDIDPLFKNAMVNRETARDNYNGICIGDVLNLARALEIDIRNNPKMLKAEQIGDRL